MQSLSSIRRRLPDKTQLEIIKLEKVNGWKSAFLYFKVYAAIVLAMIVASKINHPAFTLLTLIFIGGRQHSLYVLNHDASHGGLFRSRSMNKWIAILFSNLIMIHHPEAWSYVQWRLIHLKHHRYLFTHQDPNYLGRKKAGDTRKRYTSVELFRKCALAVPTTLIQFFRGKQDYVSPGNFKFYPARLNHLETLFKPFTHDPEMENERRFKLLFFSLLLAILIYFDLGKLFLLFWIVPMYTIYPIILKYFDLTEHYWEKQSLDLNVNTRSQTSSFLKKCLISFLPRGLHQEHHLFPRVPVVNLPKLKKFIVQSVNDHDSNINFNQIG